MNVMSDWANSTLSYESLIESMRLMRKETSSMPVTRIMTSVAMTELRLKKMCRSKRRRIREKWMKNPKNYESAPMTSIMLIPDRRGQMAICHPSVRREMERQQDAKFFAGCAIIKGLGFKKEPT